MMKRITALIAALVAGLVVGSYVSRADAHERHGCPACGPIAPTTLYKTVHIEKSYTHYHDESVYKHVVRIHRIVTVTRVQPIIHIHDVTRIHHRTIVRTQDAYEHMTEHLAPIRYTYRSTKNFYDCGCGGY